MNPQQGNVEQKFMGFYNSVASSFKKFSVSGVMGPRGRSGSNSEASKGNECNTPPPPVEGAEEASGLQQTADIPIDEPEIPELPEEPELPPGVLKKDNGITYKLLTPEYTEAATDLLCNHFFKDEPLGKALHLESPREVDYWLSNVVPHMVNHGVSVMAVDEDSNDRLVGVAINVPRQRRQKLGADDFLTWIDPAKDTKIFRIISFLQYITSDIDFHTEFNVDKVFKMEMLNVNKEYCGRGIASTLVEQSIEVSRNNDYKCIQVETTGIFSAKIYARNGFKTIREVPYAAQRENGRPIFPSTGIHTSARVCVKILN